MNIAMVRSNYVDWRQCPVCRTKNYPRDNSGKLALDWYVMMLLIDNVSTYLLIAGIVTGDCKVKIISIVLAFTAQTLQVYQRDLELIRNIRIYRRVGSLTHHNKVFRLTSFWLLGCASSCFSTVAYSTLTSSALRLRVIVLFSSILTSSTLRLCVVVPFNCSLNIQYSHLRLLGCASLCFSTAYSILTSSTLRMCVIVFFNFSLNTHIFGS